MWKLLVFWIIELAVIEYVLPLKNVVLTIEPATVTRRSHATLQCLYDLEGNSLYSVKWYRGTREFYRYTPRETPSTKIFSTPDISVDEGKSNSTQVTLINIDFPLSGKFTCEVTTEDPLSTRFDTKSMLVVQLPTESPKISVGRQTFDYGDTLQANCSSYPSRPRAKLTFYLNDNQVAQTEPLSPRQAQEIAWSDLVLRMKLSEFHFSNGRLILQCIAEIEDIYHEAAILRLDSAREPVPERVSAFNGGNSYKSYVQASPPFLILLGLLLFVS